MTDDAPGRLQRSQDARRARVIETVLELLREGGTDSVRLRTVWERTGVGTDTIYRYFRSRDAIVARDMVLGCAVANRVAEDVTQQ